MWSVRTIGIPLRKQAEVGRRGQRRGGFQGGPTHRHMSFTSSFQQGDLKQFSVNLCQGSICTNREDFFF